MYLFQQQLHQEQQRVSSRRSKMRLSIDTTLSNNNINQEPEDHPDEPGAIPKRKSPNGGVSPRSTGTGAGTTFQQYRQQRSVRKHPWRTDVKGRGNRKTAKSWRHLVKSASPWDEFPSIIEEGEEEWINRTESKESETSANCALSVEERDVKKEDSGRTGAAQDEQEPPKDELLESLRERLKKVYQGDHYTVNGVGTGRGKAPPAKVNQQEKLVRQQLVRALQDRLENFYTGHLVSYESYGRQGAAHALEEKTEESQEEVSDDGSAASIAESVVSVQSMIVAATILHSKKAPAMESRKQPSNAPQISTEDDEWTEYTLESRGVQHSAASQGSARANGEQREGSAAPLVQQTVSAESEWEEHTVYDDETVHPPAQTEEEWEEETVATEALSRGQQIKLLQASLPQVPARCQPQQADDDAEWDEYTVETSALPQQMVALSKQELEWDEYTVESVFNPLASVPVKDPSLLAQVLSSPQPRSKKIATPPIEQSTAEDDGYEWDEYTVETIADALLSLPRALDMHRLGESTTPANREPVTRNIRESSESPSSIHETVKSIVKESNTRLAEFDDMRDAESVSYTDEIIEDEYDDDDHWDDYTVETVADAFASLPRKLQLEFLRTTTSVRSAPRYQDEGEDDESSEGSSLPPEGAFCEEDAPTSRADHDEWTEVTCEETIHDIPGILREVDSAKCATQPTKNSGTKKIVTDPTLSSTDSESETWHDARSSGSGGDPAFIKESSCTGSVGGRSRGSAVPHRRTRSPPTNLNQVLKEDIFSQDLEVVERALQNLAQKADDDLEYRAHIVRSGGILAIVRAMQQNVYKSKIQVMACKTLEKISTDRENRVSIGEVGGVEAVVGAMAEHMAEENVAEITCVALWKLTSDCPSNQLSIEAAALDTIVSCMRRYAKNPTIQEKAFQTLANLCLEDEEKLALLSQIGGFVVMSTALVIHWENPKVKNEAISTLAQLFARLAETQNA